MESNHMEHNKENNKENSTESNNELLERISSKKLDLFVLFLITALVMVILWPFVTTTIQAGFVGVYYSRLFGGTVMNKTWGEGLQFHAPWDDIIPYDARAQSNDYSVTALTKGGLNVKVDMSVIWYIKKDQAAELHKIMGPEYKTVVIDPSVVSVVRSIIGNAELSQLYDGSPLKLQQDVLKLLSETLNDAPFSIHSILIREVNLPDKVAGAISQKFTSEQNVLAERYNVLQAIERYKRNYVDAESIRFSQSIINEGMSEAYLRYQGIVATKELAESANAKIVIIGDKDGLPLILNTDTIAKSDTLPDGINKDEYHNKENPRRESFLSLYDQIEETLEQLDSITNDVLSDFPSSEESIHSSSTLPQISNVPTREPEGED